MDWSSAVQEPWEVSGAGLGPADDLSVPSLLIMTMHDDVIK